MARLLVFLLFIDMALLLTALIDCISTDKVEIRSMPKSVWIIAILFLSPFSAIAWFLTGRRQLVESTSRAAHPAGRGLRSSRPVAPDDDPEFLRKLSRRGRNEEDEVLRRMEDDLQRRDDDGDDGTSSGKVR